MFDEFDPGLPMMVVLLVGLFLTIVYIDLSARDLSAVAFTAIAGFFVVLAVISFRYHCVAKAAFRSEGEREGGSEGEAGS